MQSTTGKLTYALRDVLGKGKGLVAIEKISKRTRILAEESVVTVPVTVPCNEQAREQLQISICQRVDALSEHQRQAFLSMHNIHTYGNAAEQYLGSCKSMPSLLKPTKVKWGESSSKHAASTTPAITTHRSTGTRKSNDTRSML